MDQNEPVVFVCEHGAAKSILAATYFNHLAAEQGSELRALARGLNPEDDLSPRVIEGLSADGLTPIESTPQKLTKADVQSAQKLITFCDLPPEYQQQAIIEQWDFIPPVSDDYQAARDAIVERVRQLLSH